MVTRPSAASSSGGLDAVHCLIHSTEPVAFGGPTGVTTMELYGCFPGVLCCSGRVGTGSAQVWFTFIWCPHRGAALKQTFHGIIHHAAARPVVLRYYPVRHYIAR